MQTKQQGDWLWEFAYKGISCSVGRSVPVKIGWLSDLLCGLACKYGSDNPSLTSKAHDWDTT